MAMSSEQGLKFAVLHRQWWGLLEWDENVNNFVTARVIPLYTLMNVTAPILFTFYKVITFSDCKTFGWDKDVYLLNIWLSWVLHDLSQCAIAYKSYMHVIIVYYTVILPVSNIWDIE